MYLLDVCNFINICLDIFLFIFKLMIDIYFYYYYGIFCILEFLKIMFNFFILVKEMYVMIFNFVVKLKEKGFLEKLIVL